MAHMIQNRTIAQIVTRDIKNGRKVDGARLQVWLQYKQHMANIPRKVTR